ncbi:MAG: MBL fold metallo-hydrolase [Caldilineae bacterium]|nr:MAG: MBL fold metallo-hydrolase [Caldilineae bacterium]
MIVHPVSAGLSMAYLVLDERSALLVDAGAPGQADRILGALEALGRNRLSLIFITHAHFDHYGSAAEIRRRTGAPIAIHQDDAAAMAAGRTELGSTRGWGRLMAGLLPVAERLLRPEPTPPDLLLEDGATLDRFGFPARVVHTPGHTAGSASLLTEDGHAFVGDLISTSGRPHPQRMYAQDWAAIPHSIARLAQFGPRLVHPGHGRRPLPGERLWEILPVA